MNKPIQDLPSLQAALRGMSRTDVMALAKEANVPFPTVTKIRLGYTGDPSYTRVTALLAAINKRMKPHKRNQTAKAGA